MLVKVKGYLTFRGLIGERQLRFGEGEAATLRELCRRLSGECGPELGQAMYDPETGEPSRYVAVLVNGCHYTHLPDGLDTELKDQDEVAVFPPLAGG